MLRALVKGLLPRAARSRLGKHLVHGALAGDRRADRFGEVTRWPERAAAFEDLDFLFTSSQLDHGVASLRFDEAALLFRLARGLRAPATIVELGRFKGGSTFVLAVAMPPGSTLRSYDLHAAHEAGVDGARLDAELRAALDRYGLAGVELVVADTRTVDLPAEPVDLLFVDADHRYEGVRADHERWSPCVRPGGHLLFHDAVDTGGWGTTYPGVQRLVREVERDGAPFVRVGGAGTIAWFRRQEATEA